MREITVQLFTYAELTPAAQSRARDWYRGLIEADDYADPVYEDFGRVAEILGIAIKTREARTVGGKVIGQPCIWWSGFASQGDGACFEGIWADPGIGSVAAIAEYAPTDTELHRIAGVLARVQADYRGGATATIVHEGRYYHDRSVSIVVEAGDREVSGADHEAAAEALRALMRWLYRQLEAAHDWAHGDAAIVEMIEANDYEFTGDGRRAD